MSAGGGSKLAVGAIGSTDAALGAPLFVTGTQRSGTTLLHQVLDCSSVVWSKNEMWDIHEWVHSEKQLPVEEFQAELRRHLIAEFDPSVFQNDLEDNLANFSKAMSSCAIARGKRRWCLKDPRLTYYLPQYAQSFPKAKFLFLVRDPRAVCHSYLHSPGFRVGRPANAYSGAVRWAKEVSMQLDFLRSHSSRCMIVSYENLVRDFDTAIEKICEFTDVPMVEAMTMYHSVGGNTRVHEGNRNILRPPDPSRISRWREALTRREIEIIESICSDFMNELGYNSSLPFRRVSRLAKLRYMAHEATVSRLRWKLFQIKRLSRSR